MSIKKGNDYLREGKTEQALLEYKKIKSNHPLYKITKFNIDLAEQNKNLKLAKNIEQFNSNEIPLVSVIMPVFNVAPYLDASIMSVLDQSYTNIELIIVNDASTDNGLNIINMHANLDSRIKVIDLEFNTLGGAGIPSNIGVDNAKGKYIAYADSDDILDRYAIEKMANLAETNELEIVIGDFNNFLEDTREVKIAYDKANWKDIPLEEVIDAEIIPQLFKLSPVPWRKLYNREFLNKYNIRFPEGDYFYEDNPLHWFVLAKAKKVALLDYVVAYHRMGREGQTMGANNYKLSAMFCHANTINEFFIKNKIKNNILWKELVDYSYRIGWVIDKQTNDLDRNILKKRYSQTSNKIYINSQLSTNEILSMRPSYFKKIDEYNKVLKNRDLTIIIPIYNCEDLLEETLSSLTNFKKLSVEVLMIDDGSTDNSKEVVKKYVAKYNNFYLYEQNNRGAGVARNTLIPLATGEYTYFLDADEEVDIDNLEDSVSFARSNNSDLLLFKYKIHFYDKNTYRDMWNADQELWSKLLKSISNEEKQILSSGLINYPWNRIIKTDLLHSENIFFGKTVVHNDVPYHWHSIISAKNIGIFDKAVCSHRKFDEREQVTNINDFRRMMVFEAYRHTNTIISEYEMYEKIFPIWKKFILELLEWAKDRVPKEMQKTFIIKQENIKNNFRDTK